MANDRVPPGRAGRLWLVHRIAIAESGADQLERKVRILSAEIERRQKLANKARLSWEQQCVDAERWQLRAGLIGGHDGVRYARAEPAAVTLTWAATVGVRHVADAILVAPKMPDTAPVSSALIYAQDAYAIALKTGVELAIADEALSALQTALIATRRRARILRRRWIPRLRAHLTTLDLALEQAEQEDQARLRRLGG